MSSDLFLTAFFAFLLPALLAAILLRNAPLPTALTHSNHLLPGLLAGLALWVVLPESFEHGVTATAFTATLVGFTLLAALDWCGQPVCADCHPHSAPAWQSTLLMHAFVDGILIGVASGRNLADWALILHRIPETLGIALLTRNPRLIALLQAAALLGFLSANHLNPTLWRFAYAAAGGAMLYLGLHPLHRKESWTKENWRPWAMGMLGAMALRGLHSGH